MRRSPLAVLSVMLGLMGAPQVRGEQTGPPDLRLETVLDEWARRSAVPQSIEARFTAEKDDPRWGKELSSGTVVLLRDGRASLDLQKDEPGGRATNQEHFVWLEQELHLLQAESRYHYILPNSGGPDRLPDVLTIPFAWNLDRQQLLARYEIRLLQESADRYMLRFTPRTDNSRQQFARIYLLLEKETFLPERCRVIDENGKTHTDYRVTAIQADRPSPERSLAIADGPDWKVERPMDHVLGRWLLRQKR